MDVKNFIKAARLRTLPLSVSGIIVGSILGHYAYSTSSTVFLSPIFWLAILTTIGFQVLSNFANDYGDGVKGTDKDRVGEKRLVASGEITPKQMKIAMVFTVIFSFCCAIALIYVSFGSENFLYSLVFFVLGIISIAAAIKYTVGKSAYGYSGFGDVFVFVFFGLLAVLGTYFLFTKSLDYLVVLPAISIGLLSTAVLNLNNMRDIDNDAKCGKNTLVVKNGLDFAKKYHYFLIGTALVAAVCFVILNKSPFQALFLLAFIPLLKHVLFVYVNKVPALFDGELKKVALSTFFFSILLSLGSIL